jgi:hypothetical protein
MRVYYSNMQACYIIIYMIPGVNHSAVRVLHLSAFISYIFQIRVAIDLHTNYYIPRLYSNLKVLAN